MQNLIFLIICVVVLSSCAGSGARKSYSSNQGVTLRIENISHNLEYAENFVSPKPRKGWPEILHMIGFPSWAKERVIEKAEGPGPDIIAKVDIECIVDQEGIVEATKVIKSFDFDIDKLVVDAVKQVQFTPATVKAMPILSKISLSFTFSVIPKQKRAFRVR